MERENDVVISARLLAYQALLQNLVRSWGQPRADLMTQLRRTREALAVDGINKGRSDVFASIVDTEFDIAIRSLQAAIQGLPDDRPDPVG